MRLLLLGALLLAAALTPTARAASTIPGGPTGVRVYFDGTALHVTGRHTPAR